MCKLLQGIQILEMFWAELVELVELTKKCCPTTYKGKSFTAVSNDHIQRWAGKPAFIEKSDN